MLNFTNVLIYKRIISGPNTIPCGTADFTLTKSDASPSTTTHCVHSVS